MVLSFRGTGLAMREDWQVRSASLRAASREADDLRWTTGGENTRAHVWWYIGGGGTHGCQPSVSRCSGCVHRVPGVSMMKER